MCNHRGRRHWCLNLQHLSRVCQRCFARQGSEAAQGSTPHTSYVTQQWPQCCCWEQPPKGLALVDGSRQTVKARWCVTQPLCCTQPAAGAAFCFRGAAPRPCVPRMTRLQCMLYQSGAHAQHVLCAGPVVPTHIGPHAVPTCPAQFLPALRRTFAVASVMCNSCMCNGLCHTVLCFLVPSPVPISLAGLLQGAQQAGA